MMSQREITQQCIIHEFLFLYYYYYLCYRTATAINDEEQYDNNVQYTVDCINTAGNIIIMLL